MDLKLKVLEGKSTGQEISVQGSKFFVGRSEDCHLRPRSDLISRHHCVLLIEEGYVGVRDFGSKNGTYVNDERVVGERELKPGDRLTIGPLRFEVHIAHGLAVKKRPPVHDVKEAVARTAHDAAQNPPDLDQWLTEESDAAAPTASVPTAASDTAASDTAAMSDTDSIKLSTSQTLLPGDDPAAHEPESHSTGKKKTPGKLPPVPSSSKDSQEAAAAMLSKFRKRR